MNKIHRYNSADINKCRTWLGAYNLKINGTDGWLYVLNGKVIRRGLIEYYQGQWRAAWWRV